MPQLSKKRKHAPRLLSTVNSKPYADENDHEPSEQSIFHPQPATEDIYCEPKGSSDEESQTQAGDLSMGVKSHSIARKSSADIDTLHWFMNAPDEEVFKDLKDNSKTYTRNIHTNIDEPPRKKNKNKHATYSIRNKPSSPEPKPSNQLRTAPSKFVHPNARSEPPPRSSNESVPAFRMPLSAPVSSSTTTTASPIVPKFKNPSLSIITGRTTPSFIQLPPRANREAFAQEPISPLSPAPSWIADDEDDEDDVVLNDGISLPFQARCPICDVNVDQETLDDFELQNPKMDLRAQQLFCRTHKKHDAQREWSERGYPDINWDKFPNRLKKFRVGIGKLLKHPGQSHFRSAMEQRLLRGKDRNLMMHVQHEDFRKSSVGYYGPKGLRLMTHFILDQFSDEIRNLAGSDTVIAARGPTGYVQMVLAPELAALLVKEDMRTKRNKIDDEQAREILSASIDIGELLNGIEESTQQAENPESQERC